MQKRPHRHVMASPPQGLGKTELVQSLKIQSFINDIAETKRNKPFNFNIH